MGFRRVDGLRSAQYLGGVVFGLDLLGGDDALDGAVGRDDEGGAEGPHVLAAIHGFLAPYAKLLDQPVVCVGDEGEGELLLGDEFLVRVGRVNAHAYHLIACVEQCLIVVAQVACLGRAARCRVLGVEIECYGAAGIVAEANLLAVLVSAEQVGGLLSDFNHGYGYLSVLRLNASMYEPGVQLHISTPWARA